MGRAEGGSLRWRLTWSCLMRGKVLLYRPPRHSPSHSLNFMKDQSECDQASKAPLSNVYTTNSYVNPEPRLFSYRNSNLIQGSWRPSAASLKARPFNHPPQGIIPRWAQVILNYQASGCLSISSLAVRRKSAMMTWTPASFQMP
jgi:hypothetical protein